MRLGKVESEADLDELQHSPEGGEAPLLNLFESGYLAVQAENNGEGALNVPQFIAR